MDAAQLLVCGEERLKHGNFPDGILDPNLFAVPGAPILYYRELFRDFRGFSGVQSPLSFP